MLGIPLSGRLLELIRILGAGRLRTYVQLSPVLRSSSPLSSIDACQGHRRQHYSQLITDQPPHPTLRASDLLITLRHHPVSLILTWFCQKSKEKYDSTLRASNASASSYPRRGRMKHAARNVARFHSKGARPNQHAASPMSKPISACESLRALAPNQYMSPSILNCSPPRRHAPFQTPPIPIQPLDKMRCVVPAPEISLPALFRTGEAAACLLLSMLPSEFMSWTWSLNIDGGRQQCAVTLAPITTIT